MSDYLITGGQGFIGSQIVRATGGESYDLRAGQDVLDGEKLAQALAGPATGGAGKKGVCHCAALISVPESFERKEEYERVNIEGTKSVITASEANRLEKMVFSSSAAVYGESGGAVREADPLQPLSPYAEQKVKAEELLKKSSVPAVVLRYFNVYGPGQSAAYAGVISIFIRQALKGEDLTIYGDGQQTRDFVFIDDVVAANRAALNYSGEKFAVFNIASGVAVSMRQLAEKIISLTNSKSQIIFAPARAGDIVFSQADISKAKEILNWAPRVSLEEGLTKTIASFSLPQR